MRYLYLAFLVACGSPSKSATAPAEPPDCTCAQLNAPVREPSTHERARWERTAAEVDAVLAEVADVFVLPCPTTIDADVSQIFAAHAQAIATHHALDAATCDGFSRWAERRGGGHEIAIIEVQRSGKCELSEPTSDQLNALLIMRGCTTVSRNRDVDDRR